MKVVLPLWTPKTQKRIKWVDIDVVDRHWSTNFSFVYYFVAKSDTRHKSDTTAFKTFIIFHWYCMFQTNSITSSVHRYRKYFCLSSVSFPQSVGVEIFCEKLFFRQKNTKLGPMGPTAQFHPKARTRRAASFLVGYKCWCKFQISQNFNQ